MQGMETDESTPSADPPHGADPDRDQSNQQQDDLRSRFREALARKQSRGHLGGTAATTAQHPHAAPAKRSRTFRRKSG
jgi:hypothetical protein